MIKNFNLNISLVRISLKRMLIQNVTELSMYIFNSVSKFGSTLTDSMWSRKEIKLMLRFRLVQMDRHQTERQMTTIAYRSWLLIKVSNSYTGESLEFVVSLFSRILWVPLSNEYTFLINDNTLSYFIKDASKSTKNGPHEIS